MSESIRRFRFEGNDTITLPARREAFELLEEWLAGIAAELRLPFPGARPLPHPQLWRGAMILIFWVDIIA